MRLRSGAANHPPTCSFLHGCRGACSQKSWLHARGQPKTSDVIRKQTEGFSSQNKYIYNSKTCTCGGSVTGGNGAATSSGDAIRLSNARSDLQTRSNLPKQTDPVELRLTLQKLRNYQRVLLQFYLQPNNCPVHSFPTLRDAVAELRDLPAALAAPRLRQRYSPRR